MAGGCLVWAVIISAIFFIGAWVGNAALTSSFAIYWLIGVVFFIAIGVVMDL